MLAGVAACLTVAQSQEERMEHTELYWLELSKLCADRCSCEHVIPKEVSAKKATKKSCQGCGGKKMLVYQKCELTQLLWGNSGHLDKLQIA